jgi:hypothetical protein
MTDESNQSQTINDEAAREMLAALEACRYRFLREIAEDAFLRSFFGDEISPRGVVPFLIPQQVHTPTFCACVPPSPRRGGSDEHQD